MTDTSSVPNHCEDFPFKDQYHYHVLTRIPKIENDRTLREIFSKSPRYRKPQNVDLKHVEEDTLNGDDDGIFALCTVSCIFARYFYNLEKLVRQLF